MKVIAKKISAVFLICISVLAFASCNKQTVMQSETYYDMFDTYVTVIAYEDDSVVFEENCKKIKNTLRECSELFDIYREYDGYNNLCTVNKNAGRAPVLVDEKIISLCEYGISMYEKTDGKLNIAIGSVTRIWHELRELEKSGGEGVSLPNDATLQAADMHTDISKIKIDRENMTVYLEDAEMSLDVGAIAKGFAADEVVKMLSEDGISDGYALNIGGNIIVVGEKQKGVPWQMSVQSPYEEESSRLARIEVSGASLVTSGTYERYFTLNEKKYHHIIDPETLYPSEHFDSVSVLGASSTLCDALSTALFCMPLEDGMALVAKTDGVEALWAKDGNITRSEGFPEDALAVSEN